MGSSTYLDIIGSMMIFGLLFASMLQLNANASQSNYAYNQNYILQRNMVVLTVLLETDLKHVGDGVFNQNGGVMKADTDDLKFRSVLDKSTGVVNIVEWKFEPAGSGTVYSAPNNTRIRYIDRIVDGVTQRMNLGVTRFLLNYWSVANPDSALTGTPIDTMSVPNTGNIGPVSVFIRLESAFKEEGMYMAKTDTAAYQVVWRQIRTISRNNSVQFQ